MEKKSGGYGKTKWLDNESNKISESFCNGKFFLSYTFGNIKNFVLFFLDYIIQ